MLAPWSVARAFDLMVPTRCASPCHTPSVLCWELRVPMYTGNGHFPSPRLRHWCVQVHCWLRGSPDLLESCVGLPPSSQQLLRPAPNQLCRCTYSTSARANFISGPPGARREDRNRRCKARALFARPWTRRAISATKGWRRGAVMVERVRKALLQAPGHEEVEGTMKRRAQEQDDQMKERPFRAGTESLNRNRAWNIAQNPSCGACGEVSSQCSSLDIGAGPIRTLMGPVRLDRPKSNRPVCEQHRAYRCLFGGLPGKEACAAEWTHKLLLLDGVSLASSISSASSSSSIVTSLCTKRGLHQRTMASASASASPASVLSLRGSTHQGV